MTVTASDAAINTALPNRSNGLFLFAMVASFVLSFWIASLSDIVNPDAICYLASSEQIGKNGLQKAMHFCGQAGWPFYSLLIFVVVKLTQLSYPAAAYLLDSMFSAFSVTLFLLIVRELGANKRILYYAAACILLAHQFNSVREYIIRDHGFWTFYLASIYLLLKYFQHSSWLMAMLWSVSIMLATLFRVEGIVFVLALPWLVFFIRENSIAKRFLNFLQLNFLLLSLATCVLIACLFEPSVRAQLLTRFHELPQLQHSITTIIERYQTAKTALGTSVLNPDSAKEAGLVFFVMMIAWYIASVLANVSWPYAILVCYAWFKTALRVPKRLSLVLIGYLLVNVMVTATFLLERMFLSKRYLIAMSLVLMLWVPFGFDALRQRVHSVTERALFTVLLLFIFGSSVGGIFDFGYSKKHIYEGATWASQHIPKEAKLYTNDYQLMYYSQHFGEDLFKLLRGYMQPDRIAQGKWREFDYLLMRFDVKNKVAMHTFKEITVAPMKTFCNKRGDSVMIFKVNPNGPAIMRSQS